MKADSFNLRQPYGTLLAAHLCSAGSRPDGKPYGDTLQTPESSETPLKPRCFFSRQGAPKPPTVGAEAPGIGTPHPGGAE